MFRALMNHPRPPRTSPCVPCKTASTRLASQTVRAAFSRVFARNAPFLNACFDRRRGILPDLQVMSPAAPSQLRPREQSLRPAEEKFHAALNDAAHHAISHRKSAPENREPKIQPLDVRIPRASRASPCRHAPAPQDVIRSSARELSARRAVPWSDHRTTSRRTSFFPPRAPFDRKPRFVSWRAATARYIPRRVVGNSRNGHVLAPPRDFAMSW